jgi:hypothetical protein
MNTSCAPPCNGSRRLTAQLQRVGWQVNRKHVQRLMRERGIVVQWSLLTQPLSISVPKSGRK